MSVVRLAPGFALLLLAACGQAPAAPDQVAAPRPVRVETVALTPVDTVRVYSGTVQARRQAALAFRVGGKVVERPVNTGDRVVAGQVLARLDPGDLRLALDTAEAALAAAGADAAKARADLDRYQRLDRRSPAWLPQDYDARVAAARGAEARLAQAVRQRDLARDQAGYAVLTADADGVVTALTVEVGQVVAAGQTVVGLAHAGETEIVVDVPENRLGDVRGARGVAVALWSAPDRVLAGRVREIGAMADAASRTYAVRVAVPDPPPGLLGLGMTATVRFTAPAGPPLALLPASAVADRDGAPAVWVLAGTHAEPRPVTVASYRGDGMVVIASGLSGGEKVVTAGAALLDPALPVTPWSGPTR